MEWIHGLQRAINYIEEHITEPISIDAVARHAYSSSAHFQRVFAAITGMTVGEYIRSRRLTLAGQSLADSRMKVIDAALAFGYETPESFTKAFAKFHGMKPSSAWKNPESLRSFAPLRIELQIKGGFDMARRLIPNVPFITMSSDDYAYLTSFTGALYGALKSLHEPHENAELLALSGFANRLCWTKGQWVFGNEVIDNLNEHPFALQARLLDMLGWRVRHIQPPHQHHRDQDTVQAIRKDFIASIDRGVPVIAQGITDDGAKHEYDIFFGYEEDGSRIIGWDYYQQDAQPMVRIDWEQELCSYILLVEKNNPMSEYEQVQSMFRLVVKLFDADTIGSHLVGRAAWEAMLSQLEHDDFSGCSLLASGDIGKAQAASVEHRFIIYCDALTQINQRGQIVSFYRKLAGRYPQWSDHLLSAVAAWEACAQYGGFLWKQGLSFDAAGFERFGSPEIRKVLAEQGRKAMEQDMQAVNHIRQIIE